MFFDNMRGDLQFWLRSCLSHLSKCSTNRHIVIIIGDDKLYVSSVTSGIVQESLVCEILNLNQNQEFVSFLRKYNGFLVSICITSSKMVIKHESVPSMQSLVKINPIDVYCKKYILQDSYYGYNICSIKYQDKTEIWSAVIGQVSEDIGLKDCISTILNIGMKIATIQLFPFCVHDINQYLTHIDKKYSFHTDDKIVIFVTASITSGIHFVVTVQNDILFHLVTQYPMNKSSEYVYGLIENNINDCWIKFKTYIEEHALKKAIIYLVEPSLGKTLTKTNPHLDTGHVDTEVLCITTDQVTHTPDVGKTFNDEAISLLLTKINFNREVSNSALKQYYFYHAINDIIFKPIVIFLCVLIFIALDRYNNLSQWDNKMSDLYSKYSVVLNGIKTESVHFSKVTNINNLFKIYSLQKDIISDTLFPDDLLAMVIRYMESQDIILHSVSVQLVYPYNKYNMIIVMNEKIHNSDKTVYDALDNLSKLSSDISIRITKVYPQESDDPARVEIVLSSSKQLNQIPEYKRTEN